MHNHNTFDPTKHRQFLYCQNVHSFQKERFAYYLNKQPVSYKTAYNVFANDQLSGSLHPSTNLETALKKLTNCNADVFIVTASCNRAEHLQDLFTTIQQQLFSGRLAWVIIDNGSTDDSAEVLETWSKDCPWIIHLRYNNAFGYASPARNRGLALVQLATKYSMKKQFVWMVDSDDRIHNEFVIHELYRSSLHSPTAMTHGFAICLYENNKGKLITSNTLPRDIGHGFPNVPSLKDEFEMGPQLISGLIPTHKIPFFYYPDEFTMEDDTLNQRIMLWTRKHGEKIQPINFPCTVKTFHFNSMSGSNDLVGDEKIQVTLGPKTVTGVRAQAVLGLLHIRDYYTREGL